jgi:beta-lactamase superfamily II metal-dependent hydrolase
MAVKKASAKTARGAKSAKRTSSARRAASAPNAAGTDAAPALPASATPAPPMPAPPVPASQSLPPPTGSGAAASARKLRVRMYRIGFGDFFLLSVPTKSGESHVLIDCGVHARDLGSMREAVTQMKQDCGGKLALVIMTHRHADHISGFGSCSDIFSEIEVERVWMPWFEDRGNENAVKFQANLAALAGHLAGHLAARLAAGDDPEAEDLLHMTQNITGGMSVAGGVSPNQKALNVLHGGFKNKVQPDYYRAGDVAKLPQDLVEAGLAAQILGPPIDEALIVQMTNKTQQYLAGSTPEDDVEPPQPPFSEAFMAHYDDYPSKAFELYGADQIMRLIQSAQPDVLAAQAIAVDKNLNNQSLVILFSIGGKNLLFAGDAQWGNWENFLYGGAYGTPGHTTLTAKAQEILNRIDFYKVGHHGSANATPKDAVAAMRRGCVGMCSTQIHAYNEVPREPLLAALRERMNGELARSDQVAVDAQPANPDAGVLPSLFKAPTGKLFIDYEV